MPELHSADRLQSAIHQFEPGGKLIRRWALQGGISARLTGFEIELPDGERKSFIARQPSDFAFREDKQVSSHEFRLIQALSQGGLPVQTPRFLEEASDDGSEPFYVLEYIEGKPEINPSDRSDFLGRYAHQLAQIHRFDWREADLSFLPPARTYRPRPEIPNETLREGDIRTALEQISKPNRQNPDVLRHGDFWPGNVIWKKGEISGVIDWEEARIGDPLEDVSICRLDLLWILDVDAMHEFTELYQAEMNLDLSGLKYWDLCTSLRPIQNLGEWASSYPGLGRPDITEATMSAGHQQFVALLLD